MLWNQACPMEQPRVQPSSERLGSYLLLRRLGSGGMGEVFLAQDEICKRQVALKRIRSDLKNHPRIRRRFLREAHIAAQLSHPSIIPIYSIETEGESAYYTMPYIEGETLREILRKTRAQEKTGQTEHPIGTSIPMLTRVFLDVCQAIAYCHSRGILHRDLKPENIIVGQFGETLILDWGLAQCIDNPSDDEDELHDEIAEGHPHLTRPGKVVGTLPYMAPERALHESASYSTDLYALGVILYQILTLRLPFKRSSLEVFRKMTQHERLIDPLEIAPYRDIPKQLADMARKCLALRKQDRYRDVEALILDIKDYLAGKPEWIPAASLRATQPQDWEFQENVLIAKHTAVSRNQGVLEWALLMISRQSFWGNLRLEAEIELSHATEIVELLFGVPENPIRQRPDEGWGIRIGSSTQPGCALLRSNIEVLSLPQIALEPKRSYLLSIEKTSNHIVCSLDGSPLFAYTSPLPITGTHLGLLARSEHSPVQKIEIFVGSHNATINCLAIPDAFLARRDYLSALAEYRRIARSFQGRTEGRDARFRIGITLIEQARTEKDPLLKETHLQEALEQFGKLSQGPNALMEYLGKSLVYKATQEIEEEVKCLELSLRKYEKHPLRCLIAEQTLFRFHETALQNRPAAYAFALLSLRLLVPMLSSSHHQNLLNSLHHDLEPLPFFINHSTDSRVDITLQLAFWLNNISALLEIGATSETHRQDAWHAIFVLKGISPWKPSDIWDEIALKAREDYPMAYELFVQQPIRVSDPLWLRCLWHMCKIAIDSAKELPLPPCDSLALPPLIDALFAQWFLMHEQVEQAKAICQRYPLKELETEHHPLFTVYGCLLHKIGSEKQALEHLAHISPTPYPRTGSLLSHLLAGQKEEKIAPFVWQKIELQRQLRLFYGTQS